MTKIAKTENPQDMAKLLETKVASDGSAWKSAGDCHRWAEGWATESLAAARTAYAGLTFGREAPDPKGGIKSIQITLPPGYDEACVPLAETRLAQAAYHLAEILNAIHWEN